ncbi:MAG: hypothetical protein KDC38_16690, partial [Planctomycetes bacterium]|nr:hypothetical protein [Planctomycetota bacterium]
MSDDAGPENEPLPSDDAPEVEGVPSDDDGAERTAGAPGRARRRRRRRWLRRLGMTLIVLLLGSLLLAYLGREPLAEVLIESYA